MKDKIEDFTLEKITFKKASPEDVPTILALNDLAFYPDFVRYGYCPAYHCPPERMLASFQKFTKYLIRFDGEPIGMISYEKRADVEYYIGSLSVTPDYQGKGIALWLYAFGLRHPTGCPKGHPDYPPMRTKPKTSLFTQRNAECTQETIYPTITSPLVDLILNI